MALEFKARVLLELGAELISSDGVAIYELVKNAIDAHSSKIEITVNISLQSSAYKSARETILEISNEAFDPDATHVSILKRLEPDAPEKVKNAFLSSFGRPTTKAEALASLDRAYFEGNYIRIEDHGKGMDLEILQSGYLTIGTPMRLLEKGASVTPDWSSKESSITSPLGEKGIGRLAAMRLGHYVHIETVTQGVDEEAWHVLELDFRPIFLDPTLDSRALNYTPVRGRAKVRASEHGTILTIRDLQSDWTEIKLVQLAASELTKLADPFFSDFMADFLTLRLQDKKLLLPEFDSAKLEFADAICTANFERVATAEEDGQSPLAGLELAIEIVYKYYKSATRIWHLRSEHLASCIQEPAGRRKKVKAKDQLPDSEALIMALPKLGPFEMKFYWFNRGRIMKENHELWTQLQPFIKNWSGGMLVYRDGFRVYPYGSATDDWLDLDRSALSGSAYKLNRSQIVGYLRISQRGNPALHDQTNREGFRDCPEKEALRRLLRHVLITKCKIFLEDTFKANEGEAPEPLETLESRVDASEHNAVTRLHELQARVPQETESIQEVLYQIGEIRDAWERAKTTIKEQEGDLNQYIHLAGVGLQVEFIAHELSRVTADALRSLRSGEIAQNSSAALGLETQLKTLEKRIRVLDLLSIPGRQRKTTVDLREVANTLAEMHEAKIHRHGLDVKVKTIGKSSFRAKIEKGQILQILDNLFSNSFYWLNNRFDRSSIPTIEITVDSENNRILFSDNGPGIPTDMSEDIFKPFVTTKPPGDGRGLGLFISRKLAEYNDAKLELTSPNEKKIHHTFALTFSKTL